jgi:transposase-like protein
MVETSSVGIKHSEMLVRYSKLSDYKIKKIVLFFCADVEASKASILLGLNRKTVNRYYGIFREHIYRHQISRYNELIFNGKLNRTYFTLSRSNARNESRKPANNTQKPSVIGVFEMNKRIYTRILPDDQKMNPNGLSTTSSGQIKSLESFWSFTMRKLKKFTDLRKYADLYLKECEWRWQRTNKELEQELSKMLLK